MKRLLAATLALATAACALAPAAEPQVELPFTRTEDGRLLVDVMLNGTGPHKFVVDTAAGATVVDDALAEETALIPRGFNIEILGLESALTLPAFGPAAIGLASETAALDWVLVHDLDRPGARGVLGLDVLSRYTLSIDGRRQMIGLSEERYAPRRASHSVAEAPIRPNAYGLPIVEYRINRARGVALIDTGIGGVIVDPDFADLARVVEDRAREEISDLANTDIPVRWVGRGTVSVAEARWGQSNMALARPLVFEHLAEDEITGLLGAWLFAEVTLVIDFPAERIFIVERRRGPRNFNQSVYTGGEREDGQDLSSPVLTR